ncbi:MAG: hypothetical protein HDT39_13955 [Lachnospiraceae bacterium]|nr:hypothetical protein [Lachnospiraceae bacterium]
MKNVKLNTVDKTIKEQSKIKWIMNGSWRKLTRGEKVARVVLKTLRFALITAVVVTVTSLVIGTVLGVLVAIGIASAITDGFKNASRANTNRLYGHYKW